MIRIKRAGPERIIPALARRLDARRIAVDAVSFLSLDVVIHSSE
jgi:hypothetical protein